MLNAFEVSDAFRTMCKIAVEEGLSRKEMENAVEMAWLAKVNYDRLAWESPTFSMSDMS